MKPATVACSLVQGGTHFFVQAELISCATLLTSEINVTARKNQQVHQMPFVGAKNVALLDDKPTKMRLAQGKRLWDGGADSVCRRQGVLEQRKR